MVKAREFFSKNDGNGNDGGSACQTRADRPPVVAGALGKGGNDGMTLEGRALRLRCSPVVVAWCITLIPSRMTAVCRGRDRWRKRRHSLARGYHMSNDGDQSADKVLHRATMMHHEPYHRLCVYPCAQYERKSLPLFRDLLLFCNTVRCTGRHDPPGSRMIPGITAGPCVAVCLGEDPHGV
jgi:hypothetical protein